MSPVNGRVLYLQASAMGVRFERDGGYLELDAPAGVLTEELEDRIRAAKPQLLSIITDPELSGIRREGQS